MIPHIARKLSDETYEWVQQMNGVFPERSEITAMPPYQEGTIPTAVQFDIVWMDFPTGKTHKLSVHIAETVSER